jgi:hypothetical protein
MCIQTAEPYVEPPNDIDTEMAGGKLKNGKATGHDPIPAISIKEGGKELKKAIYELFLKIWKISYHMIGNMAYYVQFIRRGT